MIIDYKHPAYQMKYRGLSANGRYNGAYYYSKEISDIIIPRVKTDRNWVTINAIGFGASHAIVFIHNNKNPDHYEWLKAFNDLILVCGVPSTVDKVKHLGKAIYLPLSIDTEYVKQFATEKDKEVAYCGRPTKFRGMKVYGESIGGIPREEMLKQMAHFKKVFAVGRCALEAKCLGAEILPYDPRFPDPSLWQVLDSKDAADILQKELDKIDSN